MADRVGVSVEKRTCSIDGCDRAVHGHGLCPLHYKRAKRAGEFEHLTRRCSIGGCDRLHLARGWCSRHWQRWKDHGDPLAGQHERILGDEVARFWSAVDRNGPVSAHAPHLGQCWTWTRGGNNTDYGIFVAPGRRRVVAHRWSYEQAHGPIPPGLVLDHLCRTRRCVRPDHLEAVTQQVNILRGTGRSAINVKATHCPREHEYTPENTRLNKRGGRLCRTCIAERNAKRNRTKEQRRLVAEIKAAYGHRCAYCGVKPGVLTMDHVVPVVFGGGDEPSNLVPACGPCNSRKHTKAAPQYQLLLV